MPCNCETTCHVCSLCKEKVCHSSGCSVPDALQKHFKKSTNENKCEIDGCGKIFSRARDMKRHMEKVIHPTREMKKAAKMKAIPNTNLIK